MTHNCPPPPTPLSSTKATKINRVTLSGELWDYGLKPQPQALKSGKESRQSSSNGPAAGEVGSLLDLAFPGCQDKTPRSQGMEKGVSKRVLEPREVGQVSGAQ